MKRTALLLSYEDISQGNNADVERMHIFLLTEAGGSWNESEILIVSCAKWDGIAQILRNISEKNDFLLIYFSMQCGTARNKRSVRLGIDGDSVPERKFEGWCDRQVNIFDCCSRMISDEEFDAMYDDTAVRYPQNAGEEFPRIPENKNIAQLFERNLQNAKPRQLSIYACADNCRTLDNPLYGGRFSKCLLEAAESFYKEDELSGTDPFMWEHAAKLAAGNVALETGGVQRADVVSHMSVVAWENIKS